MLNEWLKEHSNFIDESIMLTRISLNDNVLYVDFIYNEENVRLPWIFICQLKCKKIIARYNKIRCYNNYRWLGNRRLC